MCIISNRTVTHVPYCSKNSRSCINAWSRLVAGGIQHHNKNKFQVSNKHWVSIKRLVRSLIPDGVINDGSEGRFIEFLFKLESVKYAEGNIKESPGEYNTKVQSLLVNADQVYKHRSHLVAGVKSCLKEINAQAVIRDNTINH